MAAGIDDEVTPVSGPELMVKGVSVDVLAEDLKDAEWLAEYLNYLAEAALEASEEEGVEIGKRESRRSVLKDALHSGLARRIKKIVSEAGEPRPSAKDAKAMKAYATKAFNKANKRS